MTERPYRLHVGCGGVRFANWLHLDAEYWEGKFDPEMLIWDLRDGLPLPDASCRYVYSEHVVEHMPADSGVEYFRECRRVLEPGGVVRTAMPSLDVLLDKTCHGDWRDQDWLTWPDFQFIQTRAEMLNIAFRWWGHQWLYDREELHRRLREAGFRHLVDVGWRESEHKQLQQRETRKDSLLIVEALKEDA